MAESQLTERIWHGESGASRATRALLAPLSLLFQWVVAARNALYDRGLLPSWRPAIPAISVGNLSVGGTGKTPVSSWIAGRLRERGAHPAIVLRGYGDDEPLVHLRLQPDVPVIASPDRLAGIARAAAEGADVVVLDDSFQHRRVERSADIVLISADHWTTDRRLLPAGPWREPLSALRRASLAVITRKAASDEACAALRSAIRDVAADLPVAMVHLELGYMVREDDSSTMPLTGLRGRHVLAIAAIADPRSFIRQLEQAGATVRASIFPDHHPFDRKIAERLAASVHEEESVICTLKDAVKLAPLWPRATSPLWYVSQRVIPGGGAENLDAVFDAVLKARAAYQT